MKKRLAALGIALCLLLLSIPSLALAHEIRITHVRSLNFGYMRGAPDTYSEQRTGLVIFRSDRPVEVTFTARPFAYSGRDYHGKAALDVTYWVLEKHNPKYKFRPGETLTLPFDPHGTQVLEIFGDVQIHDIHDQPAGPYEGSILVTITAA